MFACTTKIHNPRIEKSIHLNHTMFTNKKAPGQTRGIYAPIVWGALWTRATSAHYERCKRAIPKHALQTHYRLVMLHITLS